MSVSIIYNSLEFTPKAALPVTIFEIETEVIGNEYVIVKQTQNMDVFYKVLVINNLWKITINEESEFKGKIEGSSNELASLKRKAIIFGLIGIVNLITAVSLVIMMGRSFLSPSKEIPAWLYGIVAITAYYAHFISSSESIACQFNLANSS